MKTETSRYTIVAITLHWVMAALLLFMIWLGWNMDDNEVRFQLHKSIGILLLFLTLVRVIWRVMNPPPPLPEEMPAHEKLASHLVHMAFYGLMIILPLAGWMLVSTSKFKVPTVGQLATLASAGFPARRYCARHHREHPFQRRLDSDHPARPACGRRGEA